MKCSEGRGSSAPRAPVHGTHPQQQQQQQQQQQHQQQQHQHGHDARRYSFRRLQGVNGVARSPAAALASMAAMIAAATAAASVCPRPTSARASSPAAPPPPPPPFSPARDDEGRGMSAYNLSHTQSYPPHKLYRRQIQPSYRQSEYILAPGVILYIYCCVCMHPSDRDKNRQTCSSTRTAVRSSGQSGIAECCECPTRHCV